MKKLLVGSIFKGASHWLPLQLQFLRSTTEDFDHVIFANSDDKFGSTKVIGRGDGSIQSSCQHVAGLNGLSDYFRTVKDNYENFLLIDSDAFPIKKNWVDILRTRMDQHSKNIAIVLRTENLESRLHSSIVFAKPCAIPELKFSYGTVCKDLLCMEETDVGIVDFQDKKRNEVFPLIRTNKVNVHPVSCGVYYDMFYHHASSVKFRIDIRDYKHYSGENIDFQNKLHQNPFGFVREMAGWSPSEYA